MVRKFLGLLIIAYTSASISSIDLIAQSDSLSVVDTTAHIQAFEVYLLNEQSISYKRYLWDDWLIRFNVDLSSAFVKHKQEATPYEKEYENSSNEFWIGFSMQMYYNVYSSNSFDIYIGSGPYISYKRTFWGDYYDPDGDEHHSIDKDTKFGLLSSIYAEISLYKSIFVLARYDFLYSYRELNEEDYINDELDDFRKAQYWERTLSDVKIGIAIYF